jgi:hypothetical protein
MARYDQLDLNVYGAEDDEAMDAILNATEAASVAPDEPLTSH